VENILKELTRLLSAYRHADRVLSVVRKIREVYSRIRSDYSEVRIMHVCGTHEHTITYYGIRSLLPDGIDLIAGPGCPVCIVPARDIDEVIEAGFKYNIRIYTYGDMYRVPGSKMSLARARAEGLDVKVVYSFLDAVRDAKRTGKESLFFGVGFETTQPTVASRIVYGIPENLKVYSSYRLTVPVMRYVLRRPDIPLNGVIAPGHVSTIVGASAWSFIAEEFNLPVIIAGFEPLDVVLAVLTILKQLVMGKPTVVNLYSRTVTWRGNRVAQDYVRRVFDITDGYWRGLGLIPETALEFKDEYEHVNARKYFRVKVSSSRDTIPGCKCPDIILGKAKPIDCPYFMKSCTPQHPLGACMVSQEGTCSIWARFGCRLRLKINVDS